MNTRTLRFSIPVLFCLQMARMASGQESEPRTGWYIVRPGDTIISITERYLGAGDRWAENWRLNPQVDDPHKIAPGQRLKVLLGEDLPRRSARVVQLSRRVEKNPAPLAWSKASHNDLLLQRDGVRTQASSSAELELRGGHLMVITENSLVYLKDDSRRPAAVSRQAIEIVEGQADLEGTVAQGRSSEVEIIIGGTIAKPKSLAGKPVQARVRKPQTGGAQFMIYSGESAVVAGGETVEVAQGMGTTVAQGEAPAPPEELLPAPTLGSPEAGARLAVNRPTLSWEEVPGAVSYTVEVCGDPRCGELVQRIVGHTGTRWQGAELPVSKLFWRVTATRSSGLDGYPSSPRPLEIFAQATDTQAPTIRVQAVGKSFRNEEALFLGVGASLEVEVRDVGTGVARQKLLLDGKGVEVSALKGPWEPGRHEFAFDVTDRAGNRSEAAPTVFVYDPDPPTLAWASVGSGWRSGRGMITKAWPERGASSRGQGRKKKSRQKSQRALLQWSGAGWGWQDLDRAWKATGRVDLLLLRATEPLRLEGSGQRLGTGERLKLVFDDAAGVGGLRFALEADGDGGPSLVLEVWDRLENRRRERWRLVPIRGPRGGDDG